MHTYVLNGFLTADRSFTGRTYLKIIVIGGQNLLARKCASARAWLRRGNPKKLAKNERFKVQCFAFEVKMVNTNSETVFVDGAYIGRKSAIFLITSNN